MQICCKKQFRSRAEEPSDTFSRTLIHCLLKNIKKEGKRRRKRVTLAMT